MEPVDPAELAPPGGDLAAFGNAYRVSATSLPSGDRIRSFDRPIQAILAYPATSTLHANIHELLFSSDGETWESLETTDTPGQQQAEADLPGLGLRRGCGRAGAGLTEPVRDGIGRGSERRHSPSRSWSPRGSCS